MGHCLLRHLPRVTRKSKQCEQLETFCSQRGAGSAKGGVDPVVLQPDHWPCFAVSIPYFCLLSTPCQILQGGNRDICRKHGTKATHAIHYNRQEKGATTSPRHARPSGGDRSPKSHPRELGESQRRLQTWNKCTIYARSEAASRGQTPGEPVRAARQAPAGCSCASAQRAGVAGEDGVRQVTARCPRRTSLQGAASLPPQALLAPGEGHYPQDP